MHRTSEEIYTWTEKRRILTDDELQIPGIRLFGWSHNSRPHPLEKHIHAGAMELVYVVSGSQHYHVEGAGEYDVAGNQIFIAQPGVPHSTGGALHDRYEIFWIQIEKELCPNFLGLSWENGMYLQAQLLTIQNHILRPKQNLHPLFSRSLELLAEDDFFSQMHGSILLQVIGADEKIQALQNDLAALDLVKVQSMELE